MCGIHGIVSLSDRPLPDHADTLERMAGVTVHRGPDDQGAYIHEQLAMGMRRLSIIDLEGRQQPLCNEDESIWLVCNGEIYNFQSLREQLRAQGHRFRTGSDSEVALHLYEQHGDEFVKHLDGMYGLALWDSKRRRLILARDRLGIKPIYYHSNGSRLAFASEAKARVAVGRARGRSGRACRISHAWLCTGAVFNVPWYTKITAGVLHGLR